MRIIDNRLEEYPINDIRRLNFISEKTEGFVEKFISNIMVGICVYKLVAPNRLEALYLTDNYYGVVGYDEENYIKKIKDITKNFEKEDEKKFFELLNSCEKENDKVECIARSTKADGRLGWYDIKIVCIGETEKHEKVFLGFVTDVTSLMKEYNALKEIAELREKLSIERQRYRILSETTPALLFEYFPEDDVMVFNYNFSDNHERKIIHNYKEFLEKTPLVHKMHINMFKEALFKACKEPVRDTIEYLSEVSGKGYRWHRTVYTSFMDDNNKILSVIGRIYDVDDEVLEREKQKDLAKIDALTGAYIRQAGYSKIEKSIKEDDISSAYFIMLDLDNFKMVNDTKGHSYGDTVLKRFSQKAIELIDEKGFVTRYGGDEFILFAKNIEADYIDDILKKLHWFMQLISEEIEVEVDFSEGIIQLGDKSLERIFEDADKEMYKRKNIKKTENTKVEK
ncbi:MAG: GGDEF domain-containing protein [Lachnospiraceae bacterium]|nr:GGDEF domain-containing protein [Lachnospiraceae bacterium]